METKQTRKTIPVLLLGAVGTSVNIAQQINSDESSPIEIIGWCVDVPAIGTEIEGLPVVTNRSLLSAYLQVHPDVKLIYNMFNQRAMASRLQLLLELEIPRDRFVNYIHPNAYVAQSVKMGVGNVIFPGARLAHAVELGDYNIINYNVAVEHNSRVEIGNFLAANSTIGSNVKLKASNFLGLGSSVRERTTLNRTIVGMGAAVLQDFNDCTVVGVPARPLQAPPVS